jgi:hypothetical protein
MTKVANRVISSTDWLAQGPNLKASPRSARTIARRLSTVSGFYAYLVARGDTPVRVSPVPRGRALGATADRARRRRCRWCVCRARCPGSCPRWRSGRWSGRCVGGGTGRWSTRCCSVGCAAARCLVCGSAMSTSLIGGCSSSTARAVITAGHRWPTGSSDHAARPPAGGPGTVPTWERYLASLSAIRGARAARRDRAANRGADTGQTTDGDYLSCNLAVGSFKSYQSVNAGRRMLHLLSEQLGG